MHKELFDQLVQVFAALRSENGCPWDREQTHESIKPDLIEETYEVIEAIDAGDATKLREEIGDLLANVMLHAQIARDEGEFDISDVIKTLTEKLIRRHPHVFGDQEANNANFSIRSSKIGNRLSEVNQATRIVNLPLMGFLITYRTCSVHRNFSAKPPVWDLTGTMFPMYSQKSTKKLRS